MISAIERIHREVSQPAQVPAKPTLQTHKETPQPTLTREDVDAILAHKRAGTPEERPTQDANLYRAFSFACWPGA